MERIISFRLKKSLFNLDTTLLSALPQHVHNGVKRPNGLFTTGLDTWKGFNSKPIEIIYEAIYNTWGKTIVHSDLLCKFNCSTKI